MKNVKTKVGITITALACFLTFGCNSNKQDMEEEPIREYEQTTTPSPVTIPEQKQEPGPYDKCNFDKITEILERFGNSAQSYALPDGRIVKFSYHNREENEDNYLKVQVSRQYDKGWDSVVIKDYYADGLNFNNDTVSYVSQATWGVQKFSETKEFKFDTLSEEAQKKITEEYATILKDAPERLSKEYEKEVKSFEKDVLGILKK